MNEVGWFQLTEALNVVSPDDISIGFWCVLSTERFFGSELPLDIYLDSVVVHNKLC